MLLKMILDIILKSSKLGNVLCHENRSMILMHKMMNSKNGLMSTMTGLQMLFKVMVDIVLKSS